MFVVVYNGLASNKSTIVRLPVSVDGPFHVTRLGSSTIQESLVHSSPSPFVATQSTSANFVLLFDTGPLVPVGATVFRVYKSPLEANTKVPSVQSQRRLRPIDRENESSQVVTSNGAVKVHFDRCVLLGLVPVCSISFSPSHRVFWFVLQTDWSNDSYFL